MMRGRCEVRLQRNEPVSKPARQKTAKLDMLEDGPGGMPSGSAHDVTAEDWQRRELGIRHLEDYRTVRSYPIVGDGRRCMRNGKQVTIRGRQREGGAISNESSGGNEGESAKLSPVRPNHAADGNEKQNADDDTVRGKLEEIERKSSIECVSDSDVGSDEASTGILVTGTLRALLEDSNCEKDPLLQGRTSNMDSWSERSGGASCETPENAGIPREATSEAIGSSKAMNAIRKPRETTECGSTILKGPEETGERNGEASIGPDSSGRDSSSSDRRGAEQIQIEGHATESNVTLDRTAIEESLPERRSSRLKEKIQKADCEDFIYFPVRNRKIQEKKPPSPEETYCCVIPELETDAKPEVAGLADNTAEPRPEMASDESPASEAGEEDDLEMIDNNQSKSGTQPNNSDEVAECTRESEESDSRDEKKEGTDTDSERPVIKLILKKTSAVDTGKSTTEDREAVSSPLRRSSRLDGTSAELQMLPDTPRTSRRQQITAEHVNYARLMQHACTLWSSEQRRRFSQLKRSEHTGDMADLLRKEWEEIGEKEKTKYFNRAKRASRMDGTMRNRENRKLAEKKQPDRASNDQKQELTDQNTDDSFFNLDAASQNACLKKRLLQIRRRMSPASYESFLQSFRDSLESTERHLERQKVEIAHYDAICRRLLFMKINEALSSLPKCVHVQSHVDLEKLPPRDDINSGHWGNFVSGACDLCCCEDTSERLSDILEVLENPEKQEEVENKTISEQNVERIFRLLKSEAEPFEPHDVIVGNESMHLQTINAPDIECAAICRSMMDQDLPLLDEQDIEEVLNCEGVSNEDWFGDELLTSATAALYRITNVPQVRPAFDDTSCFLSSLLAMEMMR